MSLLWTAVLPGFLVVLASIGFGYFLGREVGREQGANDVRRRLSDLRRASRDAGRG